MKKKRPCAGAGAKGHLAKIAASVTETTVPKVHKANRRLFAAKMHANQVEDMSVYKQQEHVAMVNTKYVKVAYARTTTYSQREI